MPPPVMSSSMAQSFAPIRPATTTDHPSNPQAIAAGRDDLQALDACVHHYNTEIPHQSLGMCPPAERIALAAPGPDLQVADPIAAVVAHAQTRARLLRQWSIVVRL